MNPPVSPPTHAPPGVGIARRRRLSWGLVDQAASSLTNLGVAVFVGRVSSPAAFGEFAAVMLAYQIATGMLRGAVSEPVVVRYSNRPRESTKSVVRASLGASVVLGTLVAVVVAAIGMVGDGAFRQMMLVLAVTLPFLQLQDAVRFVGFTWGRSSVAAASDLVWLALLVVGGIALRVDDVESATPFFVLWCGAGALSAIVGLRMLGVGPHLGQARRYLREHRRLASSYAYEAVAHQGAPRLTSAGVGLFAGVADFAGLRGAQLFSSQLAVLTQAVRIVAVPESVRGADLRAQVRVANTAMRLLLAATLAGSLVLLVVPDALGRQLLGQTWDLAEPLLFWVLLRQAFASAAIGPEIVLRALAAARWSFRGRTITGVLLIVLGLGGAALDGATGAVIGMAAGQGLATVYWFYASARARAAVTAPAEVTPS